jgi:sugar phosphate permease
MWAVLIPAVCNAAWGLWVWTMVPARPSTVGLTTDEAPKPKAGDDEKNLPPPISFIDAFKIPAVAQYAIAFGFFKFINYAMFMWLPFLLTSNFSPSTANVISTLYDVGMMPGGIIVGYVSDLFGGRRACVIVTMLTMLIPLLWVLSEFEETLPVYGLLIILGLMGILVGGPNNIVTSAVAADLASHPSIQGNNRALGTVTGIINGSGSITAALGLQAIVPIQNAYGWTGVWYLLIVSNIIGCALLMPKVLKEIYSHEEDVAPPPPKAGYQAVKNGPSKV